MLLDVLRGLALYGVLLANALPWFSGRAFVPRDVLLSRATWRNDATLLLTGIFVDGKAMTVLTFLFGLGFSIQMRRAEARGHSVVALHLRRVAALLFFGISHILLLWWGDILWGYAVAGAWLVLFRRLRGSGLIACALFLALVPPIAFSFPAVGKALTAILPEPANREAFHAEVLAAITGSDRYALVRAQVKQAYYHVGGVWISYILSVLGRFLVGYWAGVSGLLPPSEERIPRLRKLVIWGLPLGLACSSIGPMLRVLRRRQIVVSEDVRAVLSIPMEVGLLVLAASYIALIALLMRRSWPRKALSIVAPVGQMALTTYLSQSLICTFLFYGWGLGLAGRVGSAAVAGITLIVFCFQILLATLWLRRFRFGPLEWLWRTLSYGRLQPMRRAPS